jgi:predicted nucleic acid-binding protein
MADNRIVIDTGPLILLAKIEALPVAARLPHQFLAPQNVMDELAAGLALGYQAVDAPWLQVVELNSPIPKMIRATLDDGEAAVIQLALEQGIPVVCLDDLRGRRLAKAVGLSAIGVLGLLGKARALGLIPALRPYADKLLSVGARYSPELISRMIAEIDR